MRSTTESKKNQHEGVNIFTLILIIICMHIHVDGKLQIGIVTHQKAKSLLEGVVPPLKVYKGVRSFF